VRKTVVTVGSFDGVHLGHRAVLAEVAARARRAGCPSLLVTFAPHPLEVINPQMAPPLLTLDHERREILAQSELDTVEFMRFTPELAKYTPEAFVVEFLLERRGMRELVIGHDHGLGRGRAGNAGVLRELGARYGFEVDVVDPVLVEGREASSTLIRRAIGGGDLDTAAGQLGRPYSMTGQVIPGVQRGRQIGYRTINVAEPDPRKLLPPDGVYAVRVEWRDGTSGAMLHQGPRPTFGEAARTIEAHLLDGPPDLYGLEVKISWISRIRDTKTFSSPDELRQQLDHDFATTQQILGVSRGS